MREGCISVLGRSGSRIEEEGGKQREGGKKVRGEDEKRKIRAKKRVDGAGRGKHREADDWYHATDHLHAAAQSYYPDKPQAAIRWYNAAETLLYQGHAQQIATMLTQRAELLPAQTDTFLSHATCFENNKRRMNYMQNREDGLLIGSGTVESEAKQFKARFCGPGMRWTRPGINRLLPIRAAVMQDSFDSDWKTIYSSP